MADIAHSPQLVSLPEVSNAKFRPGRRIVFVLPLRCVDGELKERRELAFENFSEAAFLCHFCGALGRGLQPTMKILDSDPMLESRGFDGHRDAGRAAVRFVAPIVLTENAKRLSHGFEQALRRYLDRMLHALRIPARDPAGS